jgi:hypothetical protein
MEFIWISTNSEIYHTDWDGLEETDGTKEADGALDGFKDG